WSSSASALQRITSLPLLIYKNPRLKSCWLSLECRSSRPRLNALLPMSLQYANNKMLAKTLIQLVVYSSTLHQNQHLLSGQSQRYTYSPPPIMLSIRLLPLRNYPEDLHTLLNPDKHPLPHSSKGLFPFQRDYTLPLFHTTTVDKSRQRLRVFRNHPEWCILSLL